MGNNCTLPLNVPPTNKGVIHPRDAHALKGMGQAIRKMTEHPIITYRLGELQPEQGYIDFDFDSVHKLKYVILSEEIHKSQRVEAFELWAKKPNGKMKRIYKGTVIGMKKIVRLRRGLNCLGVRLVIRQSRKAPRILPKSDFTNDYAKAPAYTAAPSGIKKGLVLMNKSFSFFVLFQGTGYGLPGTRGGLAKIGGAFTHLGAGLRCALAQCLAGAFCCGFLLCGGFADDGVRFCGGIFLLLGAAQQDGCQHGYGQC